MCDLDLYIFLLFYYLTYIYLIILKNEGSRRAVRPDRTSARCASVSPRLLTRYLTTNRVHGTRVFLGRHASLSSRIVLVVAVSSSSPDQDDEVRMTMIAIAENRCRAATQRLHQRSQPTNSISEEKRNCSFIFEALSFSVRLLLSSCDFARALIGRKFLSFASLHSFP